VGRTARADRLTGFAVLALSIGLQPHPQEAARARPRQPPTELTQWRGRAFSFSVLRPTIAKSSSRRQRGYAALKPGQRREANPLQIAIDQIVATTYRSNK
jgi:hypothetical protein